MTNKEQAIKFGEWLLTQRLSIVMDVNGYVWQYNRMGGRKYTTAELYDIFMSGESVND